MRVFSKLVSAAVALLLASIGFVALESAPANAALKGSMFDPGLIISDSVFYDFGAMSVDDIQKFLDSKVDTCLASSTGPTCLRYYKMDTQAKTAVAGRCDAIPAATNQTSAQIIYTVANACHINPRVLIVTLQKEQGLVQAQKPTPYMYRAAVGYGCPDSKPEICGKDSKITGLFNQLYWAAGQFQWYGDPNGSFTYLKVGTNISVRYHPDACTAKNTDGTCAKWVNQCGNKTFLLKSQATAALYYYTPYTPNAAALNNLYGSGDSCSAYGNRNFWRFYSDWFGSPIGGGFLLKSSTSGTYLIVDDKKYLISDTALANSLTPLGPLGTVSQPYLDSFTDAGTLTPLVQSVTKKYFMLADGKKFAVPNCNAAAALGLDCAQAVTLTANQLAALPNGGTATSLITDAQGARYLISNGQIHQVLDDTSVTAANLTLPASSGISLDAFAYLPWGAPIATNKTLITDSSTGQVGIYVDGQFYRIDSQTAKDINFATWFRQSSATLTPSGLSAVESGLTIKPFITDENGNNWLITNAGKQSISGTSPLVSNTAEVSAQLVAPIPTVGHQISAPAFIQPTGSNDVYFAQTDSARLVASGYDEAGLLALVAQPDIVSVPPSAFAQLKVGNVIFAPGSVVKAKGDPNYYGVVDQAHLIKIVDADAVSDLGLSSHGVKASYLSGYTSVGTYSGVRYKCTGLDYVANNGWGLQIDATAVTSYPKSTIKLGDALCSQLLLISNPMAGRFIYDTDTRRYYLLDAGKKRLISSAAAYRKLSAGLIPAYEVSAKFASRIPSGAPATTAVPAPSSGGTGTSGSTGTTALKYTVKSGDTLGAIAARYKVTLTALMQANGITNANSLRVGQVLTIPKS